jgi:hypothetical protein
MNVAHYILENELALLWPVGYLVYRCLILPRFTDTDDAGYDNPAAGKLIFSVLSVMFLVLFVITSGGDIWFVAQSHIFWGTLTLILAIGIVGLLATQEWLHKQDNRYVDLNTGSDEKRCAHEAKAYDKATRTVQLGTWTWVALFAVATLWLWRIAT